jgi:hypothetical protein
METPSTASSIESRKVTLARAETNTPTLIGQLKLIRESWGEGFDEDIAQPLARLLLTLRKQFEASQEAHEEELDSRDEALAEAESATEENADEAGRYRTLIEELEDVPRGVRTLEEVMDNHDAQVAAQGH